MKPDPPWSPGGAPDDEKKEGDDDVALFRAAMRGVEPAPPADRAILSPILPPPLPVQTRRDEQQVLTDSLSDHDPWQDDIESGEELIFLRPGLPTSLLRKLRRGLWVIQGQLDLHGHHSASARPEVAEFLNHSLKQGYRCVRIIHGKGLGSPNREPVLKNKVRAWLMQRDEVLAFTQARPVDGGGGAVLVLLKSR